MTNRRVALTFVAMVSVAACGSRPLPPAIPAGSPQVIHAEIRDSSVDALPDYRILVSPDIILAIVDAGGSKSHV